ncbi:hypothetical protein NUACC21_09210 [Scytonema sp. NUACC21]
MKNRVMANPIHMSVWDKVGFLAKRKNFGVGVFVMVMSYEVGVNNF